MIYIDKYLSVCCGYASKFSSSLNLEMCVCVQVCVCVCVCVRVRVCVCVCVYLKINNDVHTSDQRKLLDYFNFKYIRLLKLPP